MAASGGVDIENVGMLAGARAQVGVCWKLNGQASGHERPGHHHPTGGAAAAPKSPGGPRRQASPLCRTAAPVHRYPVETWTCEPRGALGMRGRPMPCPAAQPAQPAQPATARSCWQPGGPSARRVVSGHMPGGGADALLEPGSCQTQQRPAGAASGDTRQWSRPAGCWRPSTDPAMDVPACPLPVHSRPRFHTSLALPVISRAAAKKKPTRRPAAGQSNRTSNLCNSH